MLSPMGISGNLGLYGGLRACGRGLMGRASDYAEIWAGKFVVLPFSVVDKSFHSCADQGSRNHCPAIGSMVLSGMQKR